MILEDHVRFDSSGTCGNGFIKVILESDEDLYKVQRLLLAGDYCGIGTYKKMGKKDTGKSDFEVEIKRVEFDGTSTLCVFGMTVESNCNSVRVGSFQKMNFQKGKMLTLTKKRWDALDRELLVRAQDNAGVSPIGVLLLDRGVGQIFLINESYTVPLWRSNREEDERKHFDEVTQGLMSNIHFNSIDHMIVASEGSIQKKFYGYLFEEAPKHNVKIKKAILTRKANFHMVEIPAAANNREALRNVLLNPYISRKIYPENRPLLEVTTLKNFQDQVIKRPGFTSTNEDFIIRFSDGLRELLMSENLFRELPMRAQYARIVDSLLRRCKKVTFFSPFHVWHEDLMQVGAIAAIFDAPYEDHLEPN